MKKTPARSRWGLVRTHTARALGGGWLESALHLLTLTPTLFYACSKLLTLNRSWIGGIILHSGRVGPQRQRQARARSFSQRSALQRNGHRTWNSKARHIAAPLYFP